MSEQTPQPEVIVNPPPRTVLNSGADYLPSFPTVATSIDRHARRIPWWVWFTGGVVVGRGVLSAVTGGFTTMFKRLFGLNHNS